MDFNSLLVTALCSIALIYYFLRKRYNYWADRNIPFVKPALVLGNTWGLGTKQNNGELMMSAYKELKGKDVVGGLFYWTRPVLMAMDLDVLKHIFVKDFTNFVNRGFYVNTKADPMTANMFFLENHDWRDMRTKLSPTFSSGKMKYMYAVMASVAERLSDYLKPFAEKNSTIEMKDVVSRFTTDVIGSTAFGLECNSMNDPNTEFRVRGDQVFKLTPLAMVKTIVLNMFPAFGKAFNIPFFERETSTFFKGMLKETVDYREANDVQRNDFLSLLLQIKKNQKLDDDNEHLGPLSFDELAAQVFLFFIAGFETSASTMTWALYELALNQDIQDKAREHVNAIIEEHKGVLDYECAMSMTYMDQVLQETLRKYPIVDTLTRVAKADYKIPNSKHVIDKDTFIMIPVLAIHRDPSIYPNPDVFDPDRFTKENSAARHQMAWLPFGEGPRNCVGMRFGLLQAKVGLASILSKYKFTIDRDGNVPKKFVAHSNILSPKGGMNLNISMV